MVKVTSKTKDSKEYYKKCSEVFKILSNPKRLQIMNEIKDKEVTVGEISKAICSRKSNTSQHLAYLRYAGIVVARRSGKNIYYKLADPRIIDPFKALTGLKLNRPLL